jgi:hypothetical protein
MDTKNHQKHFKIRITHSQITQKVKRIILKFLLLLRSILVDFAFSGTCILVMDHKIIKTKLKFVFSVVELPKKSKNQTMTFGPFFHFFGHFTTLRARISVKHCPKVKIIAKF